MIISSKKYLTLLLLAFFKQYLDIVWVKVDLKLKCNFDFIQSQVKIIGLKLGDFKAQINVESAFFTLIFFIFQLYKI